MHKPLSNQFPRHLAASGRSDSWNMCIRWSLQSREQLVLWPWRGGIAGWCTWIWGAQMNQREDQYLLVMHSWHIRAISLKIKSQNIHYLTSMKACCHYNDYSNFLREARAIDNFVALSLWSHHTAVLKCPCALAHVLLAIPTLSSKLACFKYERVHIDAAESQYDYKAQSWAVQQLGRKTQQICTGHRYITCNLNQASAESPFQCYVCQ